MTPLERLADAVRAEGGYVMEVIERRYGRGWRVRLWFPFEAGAKRTSLMARSFGWSAQVMPHYEGLEFGASGAQVTVQMPVSVNGAPRDALGSGDLAIGDGLPSAP